MSTFDHTKNKPVNADINHGNLVSQKVITIQHDNGRWYFAEFKS